MDLNKIFLLLKEDHKIVDIMINIDTGAILIFNVAETFDMNIVICFQRKMSNCRLSETIEANVLEKTEKKIINHPPM